MATLTETAYYARKGMVFGAIAIICLIILRSFINLSAKIWKNANPPEPPPPSAKFGQLPKLIFPAQENLPQITYRLETIEGAPPKLNDIGKVYFVPGVKTSLLSLDRAKDVARKMGFRDEPELVSGSVYRWKTSLPQTTLEMDKNTQNFHLRYDYSNDQELLDNKNLPSDQQALGEAKAFLGNLVLLKSDLEKGTGEFIHYHFVLPNLVPAIALSETDFVRVNLFRENLDDLRILPPNPKKSLVTFLFSGSRSFGKRMVEVDYTYASVSRDIFATYPLRPVNGAWKEFQSGNGYVAHLGQNSNGQVVIRRIYLAYYDSENAQHYLQPIYVFEGDKDFFGYYPAIDPKFLE